ncbi:MAG: tetratricopeptide repeat protein [Planctomycetota bacterium]|jgi:TolA-binding protein|nr:tetratricopeptide repeat protein [Planctomycetota bacterium]
MIRDNVDAWPVNARVWLRLALSSLLALAFLAVLPGRAGESAAVRLDTIRRIINERGEYDLAERQLKTFIGENPGRPASAEAILLLGYCQDKQRKNQEAAETYLRVTQEFPAAPDSLKSDACLGAADALYRLARYQEAAEQYSRVILLDQKPEQVETALLWRAEAYNRQGLAEREAGRDARSWLMRAAGDFREFANRYPDSKNLPSALYGAAFSLFDASDDAGAEELFQRFLAAFSDDPRSEEVRYYQGEALLGLERHAEAGAVFSKLLADLPQGAYAADAAAGLAWAEQGQGRPAEAAAKFEEAAKLAAADPDKLLVHLYDAGCAWRQAGDADQAAKNFQEVAKATQHPLNALAWFRLGTLWQERARDARERAESAATPAERERLDALRQQMGKDAILYFRKALDTGKLGPEEVEARSIMGEVLMDAGEYAEAGKVFAEVARTAPDSPRAPWALYHQALAHHADPELGLSAAIQPLRQCLEYPDARVRLQATWALADYLAESGVLEESRELRRWLARDGMEWARNWRDREGQGDPQLVSRSRLYSVDSLFQLGEGYYRSGDLTRATGFYQEILTGNPDTPQAVMANLRLGEIAEAEKDLPAAIRRYQETMAAGTGQPKHLVSPAIAYAHLELGIIRLREGQGQSDPATRQKTLQDALQNLNAAGADAPPDLNKARLSYYLAETKYALGMKKEAVADYRQSLSLDPAGELSPAAAFGLAWALKDTRDFPAALVAVEPVIDATPWGSLRPNAILLAAAVSRENNDSHAAETYLNRFLADYPGHALVPQATLELATTLDETGRHAEAAAGFQKFLQDYPDDPAVPQALLQRSWSLWNQARPDIERVAAAEAKWLEASHGGEVEDLPPADQPAARAARAEWEDLSRRINMIEDDILAALRDLVERYPDFSALDAAWLRIGEILYDRHDYTQAAAAYRRAQAAAVTRKSDLADKAIYRLAWSLQRQAEEADNTSKQAVTEADRDAARKEMWDRRLAAIETFESIIANYSQGELASESCFRAAELRRRSGQDSADPEKQAGWFATARERYSQAVEKSDKDASYRRAAEYGLALTLLLEGKASEARDRFRAFLSSRDDGSYTQEAYWGLGSAGLELGAYAESLTAFEQALAIDKDSETAAKSRFGLGLAALQSGDRERARTEFLSVDFYYSNYPEWAAAALVAAARSAIQDGNRDKAIGDLERILARYPASGAALEARDLQAELSTSGG